MKEQYIKFCKNMDETSRTHREGVSVFAQPWFLDAICGADNWDVCMDFGKNGEVNGTMTYHFAKKWGFKILKLPALTPYMSVWLQNDPTWKTEHRLSFEKTVLKNLIEQLPKTLFSMQMYPPDLHNWLPFLWKGYRIEPLMNYVIDDLEDSQKVWENMKSTVRNKIRKAEKAGIKIEIRDDFDTFYTIFRKTVTRLDYKTGATRPILEKLHAEIRQRDAGKIFFAIDTDGTSRDNREEVILAAIYMIWDAKKATYWVATMDDKTGKNGATSLLMWHILQELGKRKIEKFEATGSMAENLESFITAFGAKQEVFWKMTRYGNRFVRFLHSLTK